MAEAKKPTGPSITRKGNKFTLSWKKASGQKYLGFDVQFYYDYAGRDDSWSKTMLPPIGANTTKSHSIDLPTCHPSSGMPKLKGIKMRVRGSCEVTEGSGKKKTTVPKLSGWAETTFTIEAPKAPTLKTPELDSELSNKCVFPFEVVKSDTDHKMFTHMQYQAMLVKDCTETDGSKLTWKQTSGNDWKEGTKTANGSVTITEDTSTLANGSYTRWFRARQRGPNGDSAWKYKKHVYAKTNQAKIQEDPQVTETEERGMEIRLDWIAASDASTPIDKVTVQYCMVVPAAGMTCPAGATWTDAKISADTKGMDSAVITIDDQLDDDQCLFVRVNTKHDADTTWGVPRLAMVGNLKSPTNLSVQTDDTTHRATVSAENQSDVPDSYLAVVYMAGSNSEESFVCGVIEHGHSSVTVQCPDWSAEDDIALGVYAVVGSCTTEARPDGATAYIISEQMRSVGTVWEGGEVPKAPTGVAISATDIPGTILVEWDWPWDEANGAELTWSDHDDAWESTDEPDSYQISGLHASRWRISGLETGIRWYVRVRLFQQISKDVITYGPWSDIVQIDLSSAPAIPVLELSDGVITEDGTVTASWAYTAQDGTTQVYADICEATFAGQGITYGNIIAHTESAQHIDISASEVGWQAGQTHYLCVRVMSSAGKLSDAWSLPVAVTVAEPLQAVIESTSLETLTIVDDGVSRSAVSLTELPLEVGVSGAGDGGTTIVVIERTEEYHIERPDESRMDGYAGETIAKMEITGEGTISIGRQDLILALDDGAHYRIAARVMDGLGQCSEVYQEFEVHWEHQALVPEARARVSRDELVAYIELLEVTGAAQTDRCDIYRLSLDKPELIVKDGEMGETYVDPYPTIGKSGGHRVVYRTANGDYITADQRVAWIDLLEENYDTLDISRCIIDFDSRRVEFEYNLDLTSKWIKDAEITEYLDGAVQADWNPAVKREASINTVVLTENEEEIRNFRRLAAYTGHCHVRTLDGSSYTADVQVQQDVKYSEGHKLAAFSLTIKKVDPDELDGVLLEEWG